MNWEAIGAIAEAVGAFGVIATLLYLTTQIRHATRVAKADFFFRSIEAVIDLNLRIADNQALPDLFWKTLESPDSLSEEEERRARHLLSGLFRHGERLFYARQDDLISEEIFRSHLVPVVKLSRTPGGIKWLEEWGPGMDQRFLRVMEGFELPGEMADHGDQAAVD